MALELKINESIPLALVRASSVLEGIVEVFQATVDGKYELRGQIKPYSEIYDFGSDYLVSEVRMHGLTVVDLHKFSGNESYLHKLYISKELSFIHEHLLAKADYRERLLREYFFVGDIEIDKPQELFEGFKEEYQCIAPLFLTLLMPNGNFYNSGSSSNSELVYEENSWYPKDEILNLEYSTVLLHPTQMADISLVFRKVPFELALAEQRLY